MIRSARTLSAAPRLPARSALAVWPRQTVLRAAMLAGLSAAFAPAQAQVQTPIPTPFGDPSAVPAWSNDARPTGFESRFPNAAGVVPAPAGSASAAADGKIGLGIDPAAAPKLTAPRSWQVETSVTTRATATDNARLDGARKSDLYLELLPRIDFRSQGPQHKLNARLGVDHVTYTHDSYDSRTDPLANVVLNTTLVPNALFLDAGASVERRASTPFGAQGAGFDLNQQVQTQTYSLSPSFQMSPREGIKASLRSDNAWTRRTGAGVAALNGNTERIYSRNTLGRIEREPLPFGVGLEVGDQALSYNGQTDVIQLQNALATVGYALDPQFTVYALGGVERSRFVSTPNASPTTYTDSDTGVRIRWAPLERSTLTAEARKRFFGNSYRVQWDHRAQFFGLSVSAVREPYTTPNTTRLNANVAGQFDAIYRARGFDAAQREALVRNALNSYGLPDTLTDPANFYVNRAQLSSSANVELTLLGRRSVAVLSVYHRKLEQLHREGEPTVSVLDFGDLKQTGGQAASTFRMTPVLSLEASYRYNKSQGVGFSAGQITKEQAVSVGPAFLLSPRTRVSFTLQYLELDSTVGGRPPSTEATSATVSLFHRF